MNRTLEKQVQQLGALRQQRQALEAQEQALVRAVRGQMAEHGLRVVASDDYEAQLITCTTWSVDPAAFRRAVSAKDFVESVTVSVTAARALLGERKLQRVATPSESVQLRVASRKTVAGVSQDAAIDDSLSS